MKKAYENYYRTDLTEQMKRGVNVFYFTTAGYEHLSTLIATIKAGGETAQAAKKEFAEITFPWAEFTADRYNERKGSDANASIVLGKSIQQIETNSEVKDWNDFQARFRKIMSHSTIETYRKRNNADAWAIAETDYAVNRGNGVVDDDPSRHLEREERCSAIKEFTDSLSDGQHEIALLYPRLEGSDNWQVNASKATGQNLGTVKSNSWGIKIKAGQTKLSLLHDWEMEHPIDHATWQQKHARKKFSAENIEIIQEQRAVLRELLQIDPSMSQRQIATQLSLTEKQWPVAALLIDGEVGSRFKAYVGKTNQQVCVRCLRDIPDFSEEKLERLNATFDRLRELTGYKGRRGEQEELSR